VAEQGEKTDEANGGSIDYDGKQADIDKAKAKAAEADRERLAAESE
jgi:hypothetical protein